MSDIIWCGQPNANPHMHPVAVLGRWLPALFGIVGDVWIVISVLNMQVDHSSVDSVLVDCTMSIIFLPMLVTFVFVFLEPLRRRFRWRRMSYEITDSSLRIVMRLWNYKKVFEKSFDEIVIASIRRSSGNYVIDFGDLRRWYSFVGKNGGVCEDFEFCLNSEDMRKVVEICLSRGVKIEAYKKWIGEPLCIETVNDYELYVKEYECK